LRPAARGPVRGELRVPSGEPRVERGEEGPGGSRADGPQRADDSRHADRKKRRRQAAEVVSEVEPAERRLARRQRHQLSAAEIRAGDTQRVQHLPSLIARIFWPVRPWTIQHVTSPYASYLDRF